MNLLELWELKNRDVKEKAAEREQHRKEYLKRWREKNRDPIAPKSYAEYLAENKPITKHLAPVLAQPKRTKGDTLAHRDRLKRMEEHGEIFVHTLTATKGGRVVRT